MELFNQHIPDAGDVHAEKGDVPPDTRVRQTGTPVPAKHAVDLAQIGKALHGIRRTIRRREVIVLPDVFCRGGPLF